MEKGLLKPGIPDGNTESSIDHGNRIPAWLGISGLLIWLALTAAAFWFAQFQYLRPFSDAELSLSTQFFEGRSLQTSFLSSQGPMTKGAVVHFWDRDCPCTRFSTPHVRDLIAEGDSLDLESVVIIKPLPGESREGAMKAARKTFGTNTRLRLWDKEMADQLSIPASPSALVVSRQGSVAYAGPYSSDAYCSTEKDAFVEVAMRRMGTGETEPLAANNLAFACFCSWQTNDNL